MAEPEIVEDFYGVYLLYNINPKFKGRTYIGYTRDPNRRIMQHNRGTWAGGAHRTSNRGPWKMVLIVHGFPNNISGLRFEWAWQNPNRTTRLQHLDLKKIPRKESEFQFKLRVLTEMLRVGPWCRLPLVIRWLENDYFVKFPDDKNPPDHMIICHGPVKSKNFKTKSTNSQVQIIECLICSGYLKDNEKLSCTNSNCDLVAHLCCLADIFLSPGEFVPISGTCPFCDVKLKWGDLVRKMKGCNQVITEDVDEGDKKINDEMDDDDVVCTQDKVFVDNQSWFLDCNQVITEDDDEGDKKINDEMDDDDVICTQDKVFVDNQSWFLDCNQVITEDRDEGDKKINDEMDDDDVVCTQDKVFVDNPSWFLDCNEDL